MFTRSTRSRYEDFDKQTSAYTLKLFGDKIVKIWKGILDIFGSSLGWVFQKPSLQILRAFSVRHDVVVIVVLFVFGGLPDNFLGIAKWVLGFGNSCCPQSPTFAGHGSSEGPRCAEADAVIQWDQWDLQMALVWSWTLKCSESSQMFCSKISWYQRCAGSTFWRAIIERFSVEELRWHFSGGTRNSYHSMSSTRKVPS